MVAPPWRLCRAGEASMGVDKRVDFMSRCPSCGRACMWTEWTEVRLIDHPGYQMAQKVLVPPQYKIHCDCIGGR